MVVTSSAQRRPTVVVIGASSVPPETYALAVELGRGVGERGWNLACGGGDGVMEASCRGFAEAWSTSKGVSIGVLPSEESDWANAFVQVTVPTGLGWARNTVLVRMADVVISVAGGSGTLSEIAFAWQMNKPIIALCESGGWSTELAGRALDDRNREAIRSADSVAQALAQLETLVGAYSQ